LRPGEARSIATALGVDPQRFERDHLRTVPDPRSGELRASLREHAGRCALLEGSRHCSVYCARPEQCRAFPFWPEVLSDPEAFERARALCPGIAVRVDDRRRARAFALLADLYERLAGEIARLEPRPNCQRRGTCCRFEEAGHELFATGLEADFAASRDAPHGEPEPGRCPYHVQGACTNRAGRALGCRTYFCDAVGRERLESLHGRMLERIRAIERASDYPASYGRFPAQLLARGIGGKTVAGGTSEGAR